MIKKLIDKIGIIFFGLICVAIAIISILLGIGSVAEIVVKIVSVAGSGSIVRGIITVPFFIFGVIQIFRGFCATINDFAEKINTSNESIWHYLYIPATIVGYIAVIIVLCNWVAA